MGELAERLSLLVVEARSPDRGLTATARADNDRIGWTGLGTQFLVNGGDPITNIFGARVFASSPGSSGGFDAHSEYWSDDNFARVTIAKITTGLADCGFVDANTIPQDRDPSTGNSVAGCGVTWC